MSTKQYLLNIESLLKMSASRYGFGFGASRRYLELQHPYLPNVPLNQLPAPAIPKTSAVSTTDTMVKPEMERQSGEHKSNNKKQKQESVLEALAKEVNKSIKQTSNNKRGRND